MPAGHAPVSTGVARGRWAQVIALCVPAGLLAGAYISELGFGLYPCQMCWWQRWPHFAAVGLAALAFVLPAARLWTLLAALSILVSGVIGGFHAGVEYGWWQGITGCAGVATGGADPLEAVINTPLIRCDRAPWAFLGVSLAGWNFLISTGAAATIVWLLTRKGR
nr:disulfide bond formation protein B [Porphyrobacter sp. GA68]